MADMTVTDEHLQRAWRRLCRPHWPATLEEALADPLRGRCIRGLAGALARVELVVLQDQPPRCARPAVAPIPPRPLRTPGFDHKRAAAGDRDDLDT